MTYRVLVTDHVDSEGVEILRSTPGLDVEETPTLPPTELLERIHEYDALVGRSATRISAELLRRARKLRVVGRAGVGVDNIALDTATELGIAVVNAPAGNTVAVAELFFGALIGLIRDIPRAAVSMRDGRWERGALMGSELKGKTLGIVGVGRIGSEVAHRAHAFGMEVTGYDPYVGDERFRALRVRRAATLDQLLVESDVVTLHTPLTDETRDMIGRRELARIKPTAILANLARGGIVDEGALAEALSGNQLRGALVDAFVAEPLVLDHPLRAVRGAQLTPHIGASTVEAQRNVAVDVCIAVRDALLRGELSRSINIGVDVGGSWADLQPAIGVARRAAALARSILADQGMRAVRRLSVRCGPDIASGAGVLLSAAAVGVLEGVTDAERLNLINARALAEARGMELSVVESAEMGHPSEIEVVVAGGTRELGVAGVAVQHSRPRITRIGSFEVDVTPRHTMLVLTNRDVPGVIGRVGTMLGGAGLNIAEYHQARLAEGGEALAAVSVDGMIDEPLRLALLALPDVHTATVVRFPEP